VDRMFRINLATFRRPDAGYSRLAHALIALAYGAYVVRRLYPGPATEKVYGETGDLIKKSNAFVFDHILKMYALTAKPDPKNGIDLLAGSIREGCGGPDEPAPVRGETVPAGRRARRTPDLAPAPGHLPGLRDGSHNLPRLRMFFWAGDKIEYKKLRV
jgi:hypothetical protein